MFKNKYKKWYFSIIKKAISLNRKCGNDLYFEGHHILPGSIYPQYKNIKKNPWNIVLLTAREHFICHLLLTKIFINPINKQKMCFALHRLSFSKNNKIRSRTYSIVRKIHSKNVSVCHKGKKVTSTKVGRFERTLEMRKNYSDAKKGKYIGTDNPNYNNKWSLQQRQSLSKKRKESGIAKGEKNPMFGRKNEHLKQRNLLPKCWVTNGIKDHLILIEKITEYEKQGFTRGRSRI